MSTDGSGEKISFTVPSADKIFGGFTVKVFYNDGSNDADTITLRTIMVANTGSIISELSTETVTRGQTINKTAPSEKAVNGTVFKYFNQWDYTYTTTSGNTTKSGTGTGISFSIPSTTKLGTTVTLKLYYEVTQDVEVPDASGPISMPLDSPDNPYGVINADKYSSHILIQSWAYQQPRVNMYM
jgi:hypothetical protein